MLYALLIYGAEGVIERLPRADQAAMLSRHRAVQAECGAEGRLAGVAQLMPTGTATTVRGQGGAPVVLDGPFAETKEQFLGFYVIDCPTLEDALTLARKLPTDVSAVEVRPIAWSSGLASRPLPRD